MGEQFRADPCPRRGHAEPTRRALEWAAEAGRLEDVAPELLARQSLTDEVIDALVAERASKAGATVLQGTEALEPLAPAASESGALAG